MSIYSTIALAAGLAPIFVSAGCPETCSSTADQQLSCHNTTAVQDLCCFNAPGGSLLQTQFWDYNPSSGPSNSWTIHGLWPDNCDGTYQASCDSRRAYTNITQILQSFGQDDLLSYMKTNWVDENGENESFWEHEWGKHGTCISTLEPSCYTDYQAGEEAVDFFTRTVNLYKTLDTYTFLSNAGIVPSSNKKYSLSSVQSALSEAPGRNGTKAYVDCDDDGAINQVYYYFNVQGSIQTGNFVAASVDGGSKTSCPSQVSYPPKQGGNNTMVRMASPVAAPAAPSASLDGSCRLNAKWSPRSAHMTFSY